jgi:diacylglycerol kinase (ATP)
VSDVRVLVNPAAGGSRAGRVWTSVEPEARRLAEIKAVVPDGAASARRAVIEAVEAGCERLVVVGGDGTAHLVVSTLLAVGAGDRVVVGLLPAGTGSDLARALAVPRDPRAALRSALLGASRPIDAGACDGPKERFSFVNIASAGIGGLVDELVNANPRRGATAFLLATLTALRRYRCVPVRVETDGEPWYEGPLLLLAVANGVAFGKGMRVAPTARVDDGLFEVVLAGELHGLAIATLLPRLYVGRHIGAARVMYRQARTVAVQPLAPLPVFDVDGETYASGTATFSVLHHALRVAGPALGEPARAS